MLIRENFLIASLKGKVHETTQPNQQTKILSHNILEKLIEIDPHQCKPWVYHNRDLAWLTPKGCEDLINSIQKNGQIEPILVRKLSGDPHYNWEIISGVRRWFACSQIPNQKLLASIVTADDKTCMILMHAENAHSKDISDFERAHSFAQQLDSGLFKNQTEMAQAFGVSQGTISKLVNAARLFEQVWIRDLFLSKIDIPIKQAYRLSSLLSNPSFATLMKEEATQIKEEQKNNSFTPQQILKRLIEKVNPHSSHEIIHLKSKEFPVITTTLNKFGRFFIKVEPIAKNLPFSEIEKILLQIIDNYKLIQTIPQEIT